MRSLRVIFDGAGLPTAQPDLGNTAALDLQHLDVQSIDVEPLSDVRHPAQMRQQVPTYRFETLAFDLDPEALFDLVDADFPAEHEHSVAFVHDSLALDV